jgi:cytochrome c peroxidase
MTIGREQVFGRMGFNDDKEIVALSGAHTIGRCRPSMSGYIGPWTWTPRQFTNQYFVLLVKQPWLENPINGRLQYRPEGPNNASRYEANIMMLPSDIALIEDPAFRKHVEVYARDERAFFRDFAAAFSRLLELGTTNLTA